MTYNVSKNYNLLLDQILYNIAFMQPSLFLCLVLNGLRITYQYFFFKK